MYTPAFEWEEECQSKLFFRLAAWHLPYVRWPEKITLLKTVGKQFLSMNISDIHSETALSVTSEYWNARGVLGMLEVLVPALRAPAELKSQCQYCCVTYTFWIMHQLDTWLGFFQVTFHGTQLTSSVQVVGISWGHRDSGLSWSSSHWVF